MTTADLSALATAAAVIVVGIQAYYTRRAVDLACHEHGTTLNDLLPASWDHLVASYGTTRGVVWGLPPWRLLGFHVLSFDVEVNSRGAQRGRHG